MVPPTRPLLAAACIACVSAGAGYGLRVLAEGAPTTKPLFYAGTLESGGKLASGAHSIVLTFFDAETAGKQLCVSETNKAPVEAGRFRVEVTADCVATMKKSPDVWIALRFTGPDGVPHELPERTKVGAVPYAMEATHALTADSAADATRAKSAESATRATSADSAAQATNCTNAEKSKSVEVHQQYVGIADGQGDRFFELCINSPNDGLVCGLMANRWCGAHGFGGGWYVGESPNGSTRLINCIK